MKSQGRDRRNQSRDGRSRRMTQSHDGWSTVEPMEEGAIGELWWQDQVVPVRQLTEVKPVEVETKVELKNQRGRVT